MSDNLHSGLVTGTLCAVPVWAAVAYTVPATRPWIIGTGIVVLALIAIAAVLEFRERRRARQQLLAQLYRRPQ